LNYKTTSLLAEQLNSNNEQYEDELKEFIRDRWYHRTYDWLSELPERWKKFEQEQWNMMFGVLMNHILRDSGDNA
jgi:broad specificity phosphatase PhoE